MPPFARVPRLALLTITVLLVSLSPLMADDLTMVAGSAYLAPKPLQSPTPSTLDGEEFVHLGAWVDETGMVTKVEGIGRQIAPSSPSIQALLRWRFEPILWEGKALPFRVDVTFAPMLSGIGFTMNPLPNLPGEVHTEGEFGLVMPQALVDPEVMIPLEHQSARRAVEVGFKYVIGTDGIPAELESLGANSSNALSAGLNVLAGQLYRPGTIAGEPVRVAIKQVLSVQGTDACPDGLRGFTNGSDPVFPYDRLIAEDTGTATVKITLKADGFVAKVEVLEASHEDFGNALKASAESWSFTPESAASQPERTYKHTFDPELVPGGVARLAKLLRKGETISTSSAGLSGKPARTASAGLAFPPDLLGVTNEGTAKVEFIIDRCGLAQLPRVLETSHPSFGWAAVNWIGSMRFKPLTRNGQPADLRITVPVKFALPKPGASAAPAKETSAPSS